MKTAATPVCNIIADDYFGSNRNKGRALDYFKDIIADDYFGSNRNDLKAQINTLMIIADDYFGSNRNLITPPAI